MNTTFSKTDLSPVSSSVDTVTPEPKSLDQSSGKKVESPSVVVSTNTDNISVGSIQSSIPPVASVRVSNVKMSVSRDYDDFDDQIGGLTNLPDPDDDVLHTDVKLTGLAGKVLPSVNIKMKVPEKMKQLQDKAQSLLESAGKEIKSFRTSLTKMLLEVCQGLLGKMETLQMVEKFIGFLTGVLAFIRSSDGVTRACIATSLFTLLGVGTKLLNSFLHSAITLTIGKIHGQGKKEGETHRPEGLVTLVSSVIANLVGSDTDKEAMLSEKRMKRLSHMGSAIKTLHDLISYVCKIFKYCFESVYESFHGYPWSLRHDQDFITSVNEIITAAASFRMIDAKVKLSSVTLWVEINNLLASIAILDKDKRLSKSSVFASYSIARRELLNDYSLMSAAHGAAGSRKQPVWIHLNGKPKQGKSQLTKYLIQTLARAALGEKFDEYNAKQLSYEWNDTQEYWEGYTNQLILTRDDLMQLDDIKLRSRTATECINLANVLPKQLTMAGVEKKGTTYFTSQFMITSANDVAWRTFQIANPGAYRRRIDFYVDVSLLDPNATTINEKNWSLQLHDNSEYDKKNDLPTKPITLPDLCKQVLELYQTRAHFNDDVELRAASFAKEFYKMYQLASPDLSQQVLSDTVNLKGKPHPTDPNNNAQPKGQMLKVFKDMKHELNKFVHENMSYDKCNELAGKYFVNNPKPDLVKNIIMETDTTSDFLKTREDFASRGYPIIDEIDLTSIQVLPVFLTLGALVGFLGCAVSLFRFASTHNIETAPSPQTAYDTERVINVPRPTRTTNPQNIPINPSVLKPVAQSDRSSLQLVPLLQKNSVSIRVNMDNGGSYSQRALFLYGRVFVCAKHMVPMFETPHFTKLRILTIDGREFFFDRTDFSIIESQTRDFCFVNIDKYGKMSQFPDITHHFPTSQDDILNALTSSVYMLRCVEEGTPVCMSADRCHMIPQLEYVVDGEEGEEHMFTTNVIQLLGPAVQTFDGECGSPYVSRNNRVMNKLLGIHIAGAPGSAYCQIILQQEIEQAKSLWPLSNQPHAQGKGFKLPDGLVAEKLPHKKIPRMQTKSQFVPSLIQGMGSQSLPVSRKPAHLVPFHPPQEPTKLISPAELAIKKAVRPDVKMSPENKAIYKECVQVAFNEINGPNSVPPRPLPLEEALNTPIGYTHLSPVYMSTSPGWPHNTVPHFESGKGDFMTMNNDGWRIPKPLLQDIIVKKVRNILDDTTWYPGKKEFVPVIVVNDCLKDELRPIDKVDAGKTRIFSGISVEDLVLMRMFFGDLVENAARNHNEPTSSCSLGINPEGPEWRMLYDKLIRTKQHKKRVLAGDIKTQDGSTTSDQSDCYNEVVLDYYDKNEKYDVLDLGIGSLTHEQIKRIRTRLLYEVFGGRAHVFMGWLYWPGHGNPSGNFLTTHSNCVHTRASMLFAAHRYTIDILKNPISIVLLAAMIVAATYGDDHVATVDEGPLHNFGMGAMCHYFALIGYELTDFKKDAIEYDPVTLIAKENQFYNINEVEFLKRRFYHIQGISTAPLPKALILDMPNWCTTKHTLKVGTQCSGEAAILAAFHWGPDFYEDVKQIVNSYFIEFGIPQFRVDYLELYSRYYNMKKFGKFDPNLVNYGYQSSNHFDADFLSNDILITKEIPVPKILDDPEAPLFKFPSYVYKKPYDEWPKDETEDKNIPRAQMLKTPPPPHEKPTGGYPEHDMRPTVNVRIFPTMIVMTVTAPVGQHPNQTECDFWINAALGLLAQDVSGPSTEDLVMTCDYTFSPVMGAWALFQITQGDAMHVQNLSPFPVALFRMVVSSFQNMMPRAQMKKEQAEKSEKGIISGVTEGASIIASSISSLPIVGNIASKAAPILKMVSSVASTFGLDYPNSTKATEPLLVRQTSSLAAVKGLDVVESIACDPANQVSNDYSWFCENVGPTALFSNYKLRPGLVTVNNFDGTYVQNQVIAVWPVNPMYCAQPVANTWAITPLANLASFFRYWTGSMKFDCEFTTSRYVSARIRFEWHPDPSTITTLTNDDSGDIVSLTVDVNGDTSAKFTVPYLKDVPWLIVPTPDVLYDADRTIPVQVSNGFLVLRVINPPVVNNSDADSNIDFAMFIAGGEDMTFARPTESWSNFAYVTNQAGLLPKAQMKKATLAGEFSQTFKPLAPSKFRCANNILMGEKIDSFPELFHRYTDALELTGTGLNFDWNVNPWLPSELTNFGQWNRYLNTFLFKRGNIRSKVLITDNNPDIRWTVSNCVKDPLITVEDTTFQPRCRAGTIWNVNTFRRTSEVEVPFYGIYPFVSTMYLGERFEWPAINIAAVGSTTSTTYSASVLLASADNFSCGQVCAPGYFLLPGMVDGNNNNSKETLRGSKAYSQIRAQMLKQEGHGQEDRKVVETTEQDSIQLSSFRDQVGVRSADHPLTTQIHADTDPYQDQGLTQVLSRPYLTHTFSWTGSSTYGALVQKLNFPNDLFLISNIAEKLNRFKYLRSAVHLEVRLNSTLFHSGKLLVVWAPHWNSTSNSQNLMIDDDMFLLSSLESLLISANSNETVAFDIPYVAPSQYFDLALDSSIGGPYEGFFGTVKFFVLAPLRLTGATATPSITVSIWTSFVNPEVAGLSPKNITPMKVQIQGTQVVNRLQKQKIPSLYIKQ